MIKIKKRYECRCLGKGLYTKRDFVKRAKENKFIGKHRNIFENFYTKYTIYFKIFGFDIIYKKSLNQSGRPFLSKSSKHKCIEIYDFGYRCKLQKRTSRHKTLKEIYPEQDYRIINKVL